MSRAAIFSLSAALLLAGGAGWWSLRHRHAQAAPNEADAAYDRLSAYETVRRHKADFAKLATWDQISGADPYAIAKIPGSQRLVGILRGSDAVVVLDPGLREVQRLPAPESPVALAVADDGTVLVAGELSTRIARYRWDNQLLAPAEQWELEGVRAPRGLAAGVRGWVYAVEEHAGELVAFRIEQGKGVARIAPPFRAKVGNGPIRIERVGDVLVVDSLLDHALSIFEIEPSGAPSKKPPIRIVHDGPIWSFAAAVANGELTLVAAGVEDHPLDRTIGAFGYIDSFLYVYRIDRKERRAVRQAAINLSELGVVTPKAIAVEPAAGLVVDVSGYGSDKLARLDFGADPSQPPKTAVSELVPGTSAVVALPDGALAYADPLVDAWVLRPAGAPRKVVPVPASRPRSDATERLGEALFFTTLMGPWNRSEGALSRFTCETCHFEGYVDGRTHHTGRGEIHAVTKPLLGLWNNRPHFSRALDDDLVAVSFNEFRVAGAKSDHDPWFTLTTADVPWLSMIGPGPDAFPPELLRKALMSFLMVFNHRPNPMVVGRDHFTDDERAGAVLFRDRCESCHEARLATDDESTHVPFDRWESLIMAREGAIVWGKAEYKKTGILPYVHDSGARIPSLRRLYKKKPYFTNGSAKDLAAVLEMARFLPDGLHHAPPRPDAGAALDEKSRAQLLAFIDLL